MWIIIKLKTVIFQHSAECWNVVNKKMVNYFEVVLILIIIVLGGTVGWFYSKNQESQKAVKAVRKERDEYAGFGEGISLYQEKLRARKQEYKDKMLDLAEEKGKISNKDIKNALGISESSATRYAEELEGEGKLKQLGKTGRSVFYK